MCTKNKKRSQKPPLNSMTTSNQQIELKFLGGAEEVGRLGNLFSYGKLKFLFDYGITPTDPPKYPQNAPNVDGVFLTHAHLDHSGLLPQHAGYYQNPIYTSPVTTEITELLVKDSLKIAEIEGYPKKFSRDDIFLMNQSFMPTARGDVLDFNNGEVSVRLHSAGHIPGASMFELNTGDTRTVFTGDINTIDTKLVKRVKAVQCDNLIVESTYAGRNHEPRPGIEKEFLDSVEEVVSRGGRVIVPAFAVGRGQEILMLLKDTDYNIWLDGMGKTVTQIFLKHGGSLADANLLGKMYRKAKVVRHPFDRRKALNADVIITTSGMLDGGPVLYYLTQFLKDENSALFLTGYQVQHTNGHRLRETGKVLINGAELEPKLQVKFFDFSAHAGHNQLRDFIYQCNPQTVTLMHGNQRELLAKEIEKDFKVNLPRTGEKLVL